MMIEESGIQFEFPDSCETVKFDDERFYREMFNALPGSKAVDFVELGEDFIAWIEVKNCLGDEGNCRWRIVPNNKKKDTSKTAVHVERRDSLDIEVPGKAAMTLAALSGAASFDESKPSLQEISQFAAETIQDYLCENNRRKYFFGISYKFLDFSLRMIIIVSNRTPRTSQRCDPGETFFKETRL